MNEDLRIGVIGSGRRGEIAVHAHKPGQGSRVVACCDTDPLAFDHNKKHYGTDVFMTRDYHELLKQELDAVFVCTPDFLHEEHAVAALESGRPVFLEKPMAITIEGCDRILRTAKENSVKIFIGHNMRYMTVIRKMKQLIDQGAIGEVKSVWCRHFISYGGDAYFRDWHADRRLSMGLFLQKGAHDIDVIHWLCNAYTKRVAAFGNLAVYGDLPRRTTPKINTKDIPSYFTEAHWPPKKQKDYNPVMDIEDQSAMIMEMEKGIIGALQECHFTPDSCRNYTFIGTEGRLENMGDGPTDPIFVWNKRKDRYRMFGDETHWPDPVEEGSHGGADPLIVAEFVAHVRSGVPTTATPQAARMAVATGYQATMSLRHGGSALDVPPLADDLARHIY